MFAQAEIWKLKYQIRQLQDRGIIYNYKAIFLGFVLL